MEPLQKTINVMAKNIGYVIVLFIAIILFAAFSDGLLAGIITAMSALIAYLCIDKLYKEFTKKPAKKTTK